MPRAAISDIIGRGARRHRREGAKSMGHLSIWHWLIVLVIVVLLFGRNRIPAVMGDVAKGIKAFKSGMKEEKDEAEANPPKQVAGDVAGGTPVGKDKVVEH